MSFQLSLSSPPLPPPRRALQGPGAPRSQDPHGGLPPASKAPPRPCLCIEGIHGQAKKTSPRKPFRKASPGEQGRAQRGRRSHTQPGTQRALQRGYFTPNQAGFLKGGVQAAGSAIQLLLQACPAPPQHPSARLCPTPQLSTEGAAFWARERSDRSSPQPCSGLVPPEGGKPCRTGCQNPAKSPQNAPLAPHTTARAQGQGLHAETRGLLLPERSPCALPQMSSRRARRNPKVGFPKVAPPALNHTQRGKERGDTAHSPIHGTPRHRS